MRVEVRDADAKARVGGGSDGAQRMAAAKSAVVMAIARDTKRFVPMMKNGFVKQGGKRKLITTAGNLRRSVDTSRSRDGVISWKSPVARNMYWGKTSWQYTTRGTGPRWVERAKAIYRDEWARAAKEEFDGR